jgi:hypothetical protein
MVNKYIPVQLNDDQLGATNKKFVKLDDGTYAEAVAVVNLDGTAVGGGSGTSTDRELVVSTYRCKTAFTGASVGDTITATQVIDVSGTSPSTDSTVWRNQTTAADLSGAPSAANLELTGSTALTSAQLTAAGLALETTQQSINSRLATISSAQFQNGGWVNIPGLVTIRDKAGQDGGRYLSDTTALASVSYSYLIVITDSVFSTLTNAQSTGGSLTGITIPAGTTLRGIFTAVQLTSGAIALYV